VGSLVRVAPGDGEVVGEEVGLEIDKLAENLRVRRSGWREVYSTPKL